VEINHEALQAVDKLLCQNGIKTTSQRLAICQYVLFEADHPTADQVKDWASRHLPKVSLATVYNTLHALVQVGLLKEFHFPHLGKTVYDCNTSKHFHFLDESTGELIDLAPGELKLKLTLRPGFRVKELDLVLKGSRTKE
jgi:Fur family iron response transcriptional regulator